jgi:hypothetical protein
MLLELLLTRSEDRELVRAAQAPCAVQRVTRPRRGDIALAAAQDTRAGCERRPRLQPGPRGSAGGAAGRSPAAPGKA